MNEEFRMRQIPGLSFNTRRRDPYAFQYKNGFSMESSSLPKFGGSVYGAIGAIGDSLPAAKRNEEFMNSSIGRQAMSDGVSRGFDLGEKGLSSIPTPLTQAIAGFSKLGRGIGRQTTNEYGLYKSKFGEVVDNSFNPERGVSHSINVAKDVFDGGKFDWSNALNLASNGLLGRSAQQRKLEQAKNIFLQQKDMATIETNEQLGRATMAPKFQAPAYGRKGLKIRTKFSR
jgi:hypothetical protein